MTYSMPERDKATCLLSACKTDGEIEFHLNKLGKNSRLLAKTRQFTLGHHPLPQKQTGDILSYLGGAQIIHFEAAAEISCLDGAVVSAGFKRMDNAFHDAAPLARAFCKTPGLPDTPSLDDFAELLGVTLAERGQAQACPATRNALLHKVWATFIHHPLAYSSSLDAHSVTEPRSISTIDMSEHGLPLPSPILPVLSPPSSGWRRTAWGHEEARDCAYRFVEGADLVSLSGLFRRSPRAIHARLVLDGILQPE